MRALVTFVVLILMQVSLQAGWRELKVGDAPGRVFAQLGKPLFVNKSRGIEVWIYDRGGNIEFQANRITYLQASKPDPKPAKKPASAPVR